MGFWRIAEIILGVFCVIWGVLNKEFIPIGWTTWLLLGTDKHDRIPRWIGVFFYILLGLLIIYMGLTGK
jgi:hypothetical protein